MEDMKYSTDCKCNYDKHLKGITCDAKNCTFNNGNNACCAPHISVGPANADCSSDTVCATFKPRVY